MTGLILLGILLAGTGIFMVSGKYQYWLGLAIHLILIVISGYLAFTVFFTDKPFQITAFVLLGNNVDIIIDYLSAFFIFVINLVVFTGVLYQNGYLAPYRKEKTKTEMAWHYFNFILSHVSMLLVVVFREGISFLVSWELMSVSTFFLIIFESDKQDIKDAGIKFIIQMHIALVFLMSAFIVSCLATGQKLGFDSLDAYFSNFPVFPLFLLFFVGFGIKAGFIPLHSWLPHAHPAAPSHISGVMSGVVLKMGIYGIIRVLTYVHNSLLEVGIFILIISVISGIVGVIIAIVQHDFKRLLAYHSIENIGIIGIGIGMGTIGLALKNPVLASFGFAGGILHILNHALFKSLLFYSAGSIYQQTKTLNIELLGGLLKKMPATSIFFLVGAIAISGLPPFNGFISEFLIYSGLFKSLSSDNLLFSFVLLGGIIALVIIGGLAVYCFTKIFSIIFLGNERSTKTTNAKEVTTNMLIPKFINTLFIIIIGILPFLILEPLSKVVSVMVADTSALQLVVSSLQGISVSLAIFIIISLILWFAKVKATKKYRQQTEPTWGCGYTGANPATHQYTATSYAEYIIKKAKYIVGVKKEFNQLNKDEIFPPSAGFETHNSDVVEEIAVIKPIKKLLWFFEKIAVFQTGNIQDYLLYAILFVVFISIFTFLNLI